MGELLSLTEPIPTWKSVAMCFKPLPVLIAIVLFSLSIGSAQAEAPTALPGIAKDKPATGPAVKVDDGYMVPYTVTIPGTDVTFDMIPVPGGKFKMGSPDSEEDRKDDEGPQIDVVVDPMWVAKTEVTWAQYKEYMKLYAIFKEFESSKTRVVTDQNKVDAITAPTELYDSSFTYEYGEEPDQPAVTMTQYAAQQYTKWLSLVTGQQYRLPTEAEWEYAARAGTATAYSWGDDADDIDKYAAYFDNSDDGPSAVAARAANAFGLFDMHGNAAEWTVNQYSEEGYAAFADKQPIKAIDVVSWPVEAYPCVVRGGSWEMDPPDLRMPPASHRMTTSGNRKIPISPAVRGGSPVTRREGSECVYSDPIGPCRPTRSPSFGKPTPRTSSRTSSRVWMAVAAEWGWSISRCPRRSKNWTTDRHTTRNCFFINHVNYLDNHCVRNPCLGWRDRSGWSHRPGTIATTRIPLPTFEAVGVGPLGRSRN